MKTKQRILSLLLALALLFLTLISCNPSAGPDGSNSETESTTEPAPPAVTIDLTVNELADYTVIYGEEASTALQLTATDLSRRINEALGCEMKAESDKLASGVTAPQGAKEIVVGESNRPASARLLSELRIYDYVIYYENDRIYIMGGSEAATILGVAYFLETYQTPTSIRVNDQLFDLVEYDYALKDIKIDTVRLREYTVVVESDNLSALYAAENLVAFLEDKAGFTLPIRFDSDEESTYEILIGDTARTPKTDTLAPDASKLEYICYRTDTKIYATGESFMVGGGVGELVSYLPTNGHNKSVTVTGIAKSPAVKTFRFKGARNAILMIGDGMGDGAIDLSLSQIGSFVARDFPNSGHAYTGSLTTLSSTDKKTPTDSAASGTALSTATKTINNYVGVDSEKAPLLNLRELAASSGASTGVITTDLITGATPGAFLAHHHNRNDTAILQGQIDALVNEGKIEWCMGDVGNTLRTSTAFGLRKLSENSSFFLMVEEGHIDKRSHNNDAAGCKNMVERFNDDILYVTQFVLCHPDTVLIVTADHETGGLKKNVHGVYQYTTGQHTTANVPVFALGDGTEIFNEKTVDNTEIPAFLAKIYGNYHFGDPQRYAG